MELIETKFGKAIIMDFVTAEHSGIDMGKLDFECQVSDIDLKNICPMAIIIQFRGGFVITPKTREKTIKAMAKDTTNFHNFVKALSETTDSKES